jgi:citrate synthase
VSAWPRARLASTAKEFKTPVLSGSTGPDVIDIRKLYGQTGVFTYDPGFTSTASCESGLTYIDGDAGVLLHRGYPIDQLAESRRSWRWPTFCLNGELPGKSEFDAFTRTITRHTMVHEQLATFFRGFRRDAHPMAIMCGVVGALSAFYPDSTNINDPRERTVSMHRLIAKMPTIWRRWRINIRVGQPFLFPDNSLSYTGNFLRMTFGVPAEEYVVDPVIESAMDKIFILHADHEQNASTSTVRLAGSSGANPFACVAAGIATVVGPGAWRCQRGRAQHAARNRHAPIASPSSSRVRRTRTIRSA